MKTTILLAACAALTLSACATSSNEIASGYTSPLQYQGYDCQQIAMEEQTVLARVSQLGGQIDRRATNDKIAMGVGVVIFWPALLFVKGNGEQTAEYARLKGEHEALENAAIAKRCLGGAQASLPSMGYAAAPPAPAMDFRPAAYAQPAAPYQQYPMASPAWSPAASAGAGRVTDVRVSNGGAVTETTYAPN